MARFYNSSIGKKFFVSITGLFLMMFLLVHLTVNSFLMFDDSGALFNLAAHFMGSNPVMKVVEPILGLGFVLHIIYALIVQIVNWTKRPVRYAKMDQSGTSSWSSRNMIYLGAIIAIFLGIHLVNFFFKIKTGNVAPIMIDGVEMHDTYTLVAGMFKTSILIDVLYVLAGIFLGLHLNHGFWSSFQTLGLSNTIWRKRLEIVGSVYALIIAVGFAIIPLYFLIKF
jgi:succinate dehydrogenase / fumarate reductase cytochrome b subunit